MVFLFLYQLFSTARLDLIDTILCKISITPPCYDCLLLYEIMLGDGDNVLGVDVLVIKVLLSSSIVNNGKIILRVYLPVSWSWLYIW